MPETKGPPLFVVTREDDYDCPGQTLCLSCLGRMWFEVSEEGPYKFCPLCGVKWEGRRHQRTDRVPRWAYDHGYKTSEQFDALERRDPRVRDVVQYSSSDRTEYRLLSTIAWPSDSGPPPDEDPRWSGSYQALYVHGPLGGDECWPGVAVGLYNELKDKVVELEEDRSDFGDRLGTHLRVVRRRNYDPATDVTILRLSVPPGLRSLRLNPPPAPLKAAIP